MSSTSPKTSASPVETSTSASPQGIMPPLNRSSLWNVHIYDLKDPTTAIGGLHLTPGITNANFHAMIEIIVIFSEPSLHDENEVIYFLQDENGAKIERDNNPLQLGKYYIDATSSFQLNNEPWLLRTISATSGSRVQAFGEAVRSRDRQCAISGQPIFSYNGVNLYRGFDAAHIFPLAKEAHWIEQNYGRWITIQPTTGGSINSVQNGLLLRADIHHLFDTYDISINPDDDYKVVAFVPRGDHFEGKHLDREYFTRPDAPADSLLRWHFRQAVLANMRGAGEPMFEHDFPPGSDMVGDILRGPKAAERMEFELFNRFAAQMELFPSRG